MRPVLAAASLLALVAACGSSPPPKTVRAEDVAAWSGAPVADLETHPLFSTLQRRVQAVSDGSELWTYSNCRSVQEETECRSYVVFGTLQTKCEGGGRSSSCCHNQLFVRDGRVERFRPVGNCFTDCRVRPGGGC